MADIMDRIEAKRRAYLALVDWARMTSARLQRNSLIVEAVDAGIAVTEVAAIIGLSRTQVYQVLKDERARRAAS